MPQEKTEEQENERKPGQPGHTDADRVKREGEEKKNPQTQPSGQPRPGEKK